MDLQKYAFLWNLVKVSMKDNKLEQNNFSFSYLQTLNLENNTPSKVFK